MYVWLLGVGSTVKALAGRLQNTGYCAVPMTLLLVSAITVMRSGSLAACTDAIVGCLCAGGAC